jgi:hypothetical protein
MRKPVSKRLLIPGILALLVVAAGFAAWRLLHLPDLALIGTGYAAQRVCSCMFISHRPLESCQHDLDPLAQRLVSVQPGANQVTARSMGLARATARYQPGFGCSLQD